MKTKKIKPLKIKWVFISIISLIFISDFLLFISIMNNSNSVPQNINKVIIVLTGGPNRIKEGYELLKKDYGKKLFISGVNPIVKKSDLINMLNPNKAMNKISLFECCIFYEKKSYNTQTNAIESMKWLNQNKYNDILLVTSSEHMPRSLFEFKKNAPDIEVQPWIVINNSDNKLFDYKNAKKITIEYIKFVLIKIKYLFKRP